MPFNFSNPSRLFAWFYSLFCPLYGRKFYKELLPLLKLNGTESVLDFGSGTGVLAKKIIKMAELRGLTSGRGPTGVCAAAIYAASILSEERRTQRVIAKISQVTEVTVRNRFQELIENLNLGIQKK